ncbi:MAG: glycosyltransferase family 4 protein [Candidatus Eisenbacteria sp.]|nr:glycosyltransferase family 4 protein [Candidatus Eisenbacteria bacterium]
MTRVQSERRAERARREQQQVLGFEFAEQTDAPLTILGIVPWRELWSMGVGAGATAFTRSPVALAARGHRLHIAQPCARGEEQRLTFAGVHFHRFRAPEVFSNPERPLPVRLTSRAWRYGVFQWTARRAALRLAREIRPDLVIAYGIMTAPAARDLARRRRLPLVGRYFGNTLSLALANRLRWLGNFMERVGFRIPVQAMILTNDGSPVLDVLHRLEVDLRPVHFLRNGLALDLFTPGPRPTARLAELGLPEDAFVLLTATRLHSEKRLERMLHALAGLRAQVPQAVAVLLGDGPERASLEGLAERLGLRDAVRFPGPVLNVDLPDWYRLADVVLSLLDRTNASNPVFEAMACQRCVVALDVGTTAEVVRGGVTGVLVPPGRIAELPTVLAELARDPERRAALGRNARALVTELCGNWEQRMLREVEIIERVARTREVVPGGLVFDDTGPAARPDVGSVTGEG